MSINMITAQGHGPARGQGQHVIDGRTRNLRGQSMSSDYVGMYSATERQVADAMTDILSQVSEIYIDRPASETTVVDCTAGVGGNTVSLARKFKRVISVEINKQRSSHLISNVITHCVGNVEVFNSNVLHLIHTCVFKGVDVFFVDPPWGVCVTSTSQTSNCPCQVSVYTN